MRNTSEHLSRPLSIAGIWGLIPAVGVTAMGLYMCREMLDVTLLRISQVSSNIGWLFMLPLQILADVAMVGIALFGVTGVVRTLIAVHMTPDEILLTILGCPVLRYPADRLKTFCLIQKGLGKNQMTYLYISTRTVEEMAQPRLEQRKSNPRLVSNIPFRREPRDPSEGFAEEYLRKHLRFLAWQNPRKDLFWMFFDFETLAALRRMYPQVRWLIAPESQSNPNRCLQDREPMVVTGTQTKERVLFCTEGIMLQSGKKHLQILAAREIRTILRKDIPGLGGEGFTRMLILSRKSEEELIRSGEKRIGMTKNKAVWLPFLRQIPGGEKLAVRRAYILSGLMVQDNIGWNKNAVVVPFFPEREQAIRGLYPHAQWIDCCNETCFNLVMKIF